MPVYDHRLMDMKGFPDQICIVLKPVGTPEGEGQEYQSGAITIENMGVVGYLPVYNNYQAALQAYPNCPIYVMDMTDYKKDKKLMPDK